jgi:ATP-dependent helicase HrpB
VNTDLALAFLKEAMQLRDDLFVIVMSATIDTGKLQRWLSGCEADVSKPLAEVPIFKVPGRQFPVKVVYEPEKSLVTLIKEVLRSDVVSIWPSAYSTIVG